MKCPFCGSDNQPGENFCTNCGGYLSTSPTAVAAGSTSATQASSGSTTTGGTSGVSGTLAPNVRLQHGRYIVEKILGQGGMGTAVLARDANVSNKTVVIKELISDNTDPAKRQEDVRNFQREVETLAQLDHPLIPAVTDSFQEGTRYYMVQEYVPGENLEDRMERVKKPMPEREALAYASQVLDILDYLGQQRPPIVHRDIKPANIIVSSKDKRAHLVDFGIARADAAKNVKRKQTSALGTPGYAPPEQYQGNADARSDLYALAATLHHLLTNRDPRDYPPFTYPPARTLNPQLSPDIEQVLNRALMIDVSKRYQNAAAMKHDIDDIMMKRFRTSGDTSSYTLGTSGPISVPPTIPATPRPQPVPAQAQQMRQAQQAPPPPPSPVRFPPPSRQPGMFQGQGASSRQQSGGSFVRTSFILLIIVVALLVGATFILPRLGAHPNTGPGSPNPTATLPPFSSSNGIGVTTVGNQIIGVSDGSYTFDTNRADGSLKQQAADSFRNKDVGSAVALWNQAASQDPSDAEALIYLEDQRVALSPHVTFVVATVPSGSDALVSLGRDDLQGAYVAQKEFNDNAKLPNNLKIRLLIASSGDQGPNVQAVARQIVQLSKADNTFAGVMGWPHSDLSFAAIQVLSDAHIPMISQTASSDQLSGVSPYFFRVAPSNKSQGIAGAKYAENTLKAKNVALFVDQANPYSQSLAQDFQQQFEADGNKIAVTEKYTVGQPGTLQQSLQDALTHNPDLIYFSGYASDVGVLLTDLVSTNAPASLNVLGGDALYELGGYAGSARSAFSRLHFTAFAYPDEWEALNLASQKPVFFSDYAAAFDPTNKHPGAYGFSRPTSDVILSYDAMLALSNAYGTAVSSKTPVTGDDLRQALSKTTFQGVSGQIKFDGNGDPVDKAFVVLAVDPNGHIQMESGLGKFLAG
ncbi:MAG TPA: ABC transporter substrate-binding protein [Ktedonobacteraceae bacterium]|nr:ABC transporter substrate-binding protein [Ktedonobacteraceae bacterium]